MSTILSFLSNFKASLSEYLAVAIAGAIAFTVAAFKLQGSRLHKAQVDLLATKLQVSRDAADKATNAAQANYQQALKAYQDAGGTL